MYLQNDKNKKIILFFYTLIQTTVIYFSWKDVVKLKIGLYIFSKKKLFRKKTCIYLAKKKTIQKKDEICITKWLPMWQQL